MKIKDGRKTITTDIAYIAGFFDGEGCVRIKHANQGGNSYYVWVAITNTNPLILNYIADLFGGKVRKAEQGTNKTIYHFLITSAEAVAMLKTIFCFLREKKEQADLAIRFHEGKETLRPDQKKAIYEKMRQLKIGNIYANPELLKP